MRADMVMRLVFLVILAVCSITATFTGQATAAAVYTLGVCWVACDGARSLEKP